MQVIDASTNKITLYVRNQDQITQFPLQLEQVVLQTHFMPHVYHVRTTIDCGFEGDMCLGVTSNSTTVSWRHQPHLIVRTKIDRATEPARSHQGRYGATGSTSNTVHAD